VSQRLELVLALLGFLLFLYLLMLKGWRGRQRRQGFLPAPPEPPQQPGQVLVGAVPGVFVGTTFAGRWLDRVAVHGLSNRSNAWLSIATDGVHVEREGEPELYLPFPALDDAAPGDALAGKVMGPGGLLVLTWRLGGSVLTSAFRADDHSQHARLADAVRTHLPAVKEIP
jgi:hypothetical protein